MNVKDLRKKSAVELKDELLKLRREQFNLRMAAAAGPAGPARPARQGPPQRRAREDVLSELERASAPGVKLDGRERGRA
jgi:hypothetical protein